MPEEWMGEVMAKKIEERAGRTTVITEDTETETLTAEEERILRMRSGATLEAEDELESKLDGVSPEHLDDLTARLALIQAQVMAHLNDADGERQEREDRKSRIVDALKEN